MADPAFRGFVETTLDALLVFEGCKRGYLPKISRRLQDFEKRALVVSGAIFVFDEEETGIKRWTDGLSWSPSRTLGNFLVYRELDKKGAGGKKGGAAEEAEGEEEADRPSTASKGRAGSNRLMGGLTSKADPIEDPEGGPVASGSRDGRPGSAHQRSLSEAAASLQLDRARERALVGSLTSSHRFRADGLVKKTISLQGLHLIGYYRIEDVTSGRLRTPSSHPELAVLQVSPAFLAPTLFRIPPIVEVGPDGQLTYKGESDTPLSPLTQSGSSGFPTPALGQSRPSTSSADTSHFGSLLPTPATPWDYGPPPPGSPRRGATATFRSNNRFDPYSSSSRFSPTTSTFPSNASYPFPLIPSNQPPSRGGPFSTIGEVPHEGEASFQARTPPVDGLSTSAPQSEGWHGPQGGPSSLYQSLPPSRGYGGGAGGQEPVPRSPTFYQPRQAMPYAPTSDASSSNAIFAYNPPPPMQHLPQPRYQPPRTGGGSPRLAYQPSYHHSIPPQYGTAPLSSAQYTHPSSAAPYSSHLPAPVEASHSPFATPPSTGQARSAFPSSSHGMLPPSSSHSQPTSSHGSPALQPVGGWSGTLSRQQQQHQQQHQLAPLHDSITSLPPHHASLAAEAMPHSPADPNASMMHQQQQQQRSPYEFLDHQAPYRHFSLSDAPLPSSSQAPPHPGSAAPNYAYPNPSGLVGGLASNEEVVPASGHGLGVSAYGEIVPAAQAAMSVGSSRGTTPTAPPGSGGSGSTPTGLLPAPSSSYGAHLLSTGLRQPPPPLPSVSLTSQHVYASPTLQQQQQPPLAGAYSSQPPPISRYGSPSAADSHLAGLLERDTGHRAAAGADWQPHHQQQPLLRGIKREAEDDYPAAAPLSPPPQPPLRSSYGSPGLAAQDLPGGGGGGSGGGGQPQWWGGVGQGEVWRQAGGDGRGQKG
ncbi:hypothetical protein JCM6882_003079 [Rhodosporidiobolus microsporus]